MVVPVPQRGPRPLLEAVRRLLAVPDGARQRELASDAVLPDGAERPASQLFSLDVVSAKPQGLQLGVIMRREDVRLEQLVEFFELSAVERDHRLGLEHAFVLVQVLARRQRPQEPSQPVDVAGVLQDLAHARHLLLGEPERRKNSALVAAAAGSGRRLQDPRRRGGRDGRCALDGRRVVTTVVAVVDSCRVLSRGGTEHFGAGARGRIQRR